MRYIPHYTYEDYCKWEGPWELIDGIPISLIPTPDIGHQRTAGNLFCVFNQPQRKQYRKLLAYTQVDWLVADDTVLRPDLLVARHQSEEKYIDSPPVLIAEILSYHTETKDRRAKFQIYESQKVKYYLIIDFNTEKIEIYELINEQYRPVAINPLAFNFKLREDCSINISFDQLWD